MTCWSVAVALKAVRLLESSVFCLLVYFILVVVLFLLFLLRLICLNWLKENEKVYEGHSPSKFKQSGALLL